MTMGSRPSDDPGTRLGRLCWTASAHMNTPPSAAAAAAATTAAQSHRNAASHPKSQQRQHVNMRETPAP
ncbi:hypothetical protein ACRE_027120 [Hapsidospora chrysogenum ATCC 11550]|uniref:Uncharacterized protein n=1 Tax=Hapsidospora chrysogenum (strain ATCC 11550 / CBS 779.69 / DSM 880 / IAM 14645 / JCM 23072 / IMI 49137) TaxID=857340 RepID=A0A086TAQ8_HAPC1|nr:hypothetical protein ACRE_027120 [Hapsidospora chrysogenum ATCC 11550]